MRNRGLSKAFPARRLASTAYGTTVSTKPPCSKYNAKSCRHNVPSAEASSFRSQYRQGSNSEVSSPSRGSISAPYMGQSAPATAPSLPQPSGTMSIGSIIEPNMRSDFKSEYPSHAGSNLHELPHAVPIGTAPRNLAPEILYGLSPNGDSPFHTSSSDSCYSPLSGISDHYLQPQAIARPYYSQDVIQRSQSTSIECFQPIVSQSPLSAGPGTPSWNQYDPSSLGFASEPQGIHPVGTQITLQPLFSGY